MKDLALAGQGIALFVLVMSGAILLGLILRIPVHNELKALGL